LLRRDEKRAVIAPKDRDAVSGENAPDATLAVGAVIVQGLRNFGERVSWLWQHVHNMREGRPRRWCRAGAGGAVAREIEGESFFRPDI
jgi:hypothetical protein